MTDYLSGLTNEPEVEEPESWDFDPENIADVVPWVPLEDGIYPVRLVKVEVAESAKKKTPYVRLHLKPFDIEDDPVEDRKPLRDDCYITPKSYWKIKNHLTALANGEPPTPFKAANRQDAIDKTKELFEDHLSSECLAVVIKRPYEKDGKTKFTNDISELLPMSEGNPSVPSLTP